MGSKRPFQRYIISPIPMNIEEVMANLPNWDQFEPNMRPNDLEEGLLLIIIPKAIRIDYSLLEYSRRFS